MTADKDIYLKADRKTTCDGDDPEAAFLLVAKGGELSDEDAAKYGVGGKEPSPSPQQQPQASAVVQPMPEQEQGRHGRSR